MIKRKLELLLLLAKEPLSRYQIKKYLQITDTQINECITELNQEYVALEKGIEIITFKDFLQYATTSTYQELVDSFTQQSSRSGLSPSVLETLAIIAYQGPVTRAQINDLRGVSSDYPINVLLGEGLIEVSGTLDAIGNPHLYDITPVFYRAFDLQSRDELPEVQK